MKEPSDLAKALDVLLQSTALQKTDPARDPMSPPGVAYGEEATPEGEFQLRDYWRSIRNHLWLIAGIAAIVTFLAAVHMARQADVYEARSRVQVDSESYSPALGASKGSTVYIEASIYDPEYFNTQVQILTSPALLRRVVKMLDLEHNRNFLDPPSPRAGSIWQTLARLAGMGGKEKIEQAEKSAMPSNEKFLAASAASGSASETEEVNHYAPLVNALQGMLAVDQVRKTRLIEIRCTHGDPQMAAKLVNAVADAFAYWNMEIRTQTNSTTGTYLQRRIAELQSQIRTGEEQLVNYSQNHQILSLDASQNTVVDRLSGLNRQLLEAENDRKLAESTYRTSQAPGAAEALAEVGDKQLGESQSRLNELKQKRSQLLLEATEESPEVKDVSRQIEVLEKQIQDSRGHAKLVLTTNLETRYRQALAREDALRQSFNKQRAETVTQNEAAINYRILQQEIETNKNLLEGLLQRSKENDVTMAGTPNNIHVVDYAPVPKGAIGPARRQAVMMALMLSVVFGVGLALFLEYLDDSINTPRDVERLLRLPAVAVIPMAGVSTTRRFLPKTKALQRRNGDGLAPELLMNGEVHSAHAEVYRQLRTSVLLSTAGRAPRTLLVTSSVPAEGKTTTVINMATVLAQTGAKVLIIDADMRRPRLHVVFQMDNADGLSTLLSSEMSEATMLDKVQQYQDTEIYLLSSGPIPPNPAELIGSPQMPQLLAIAEKSFKYVIIDSPPISSFTDGVLISSLVDGVLMVVHGGKTSRQVARHTRQMLQEIGARIIGVVLNKIDLRSQDHHYYRQYYRGDYYSHYGPGPNDKHSSPAG
ncbi:MAG: polysaccharide biosynthesis transport protein [Blastocatellia bacterium]|jgi:capsular exopolysaccharide synthesis family protein|nr:polysaccharide biosynthesis transport protein [Blastocatellia bacterium]